jgi:DNA-binding SARP family transcriptional activator
MKKENIYIYRRTGKLAVTASLPTGAGAFSLPSPAALRISMLGRFEVLRDGQAVTDREWTTRKAKALFKLLVLHRPTGLHQEQAIEWLWPGESRARGATSLKTAVKLLRRAVEPGRDGPTSRVLSREGPMLRFAAADAWVDLDEHAARVASARLHATAGRPGEAIAELERAVALYRGDLLDPEDRYEDWARPAREEGQRAHADGLTHLASLRASCDDYAGAADAMRAVLRIDPLRESAYRSLMQYALRRGRRDEALALYAECAERLRDELGVEPEPATTGVLDEARRSA